MVEVTRHKGAINREVVTVQIYFPESFTAKEKAELVERLSRRITFSAQQLADDITSNRLRV